MSQGPFLFHVNERPLKVISRPWFRLLSTAWLGASLLFTGILVALLAMDVSGPLLLISCLIEALIIGFTLSTASQEISRHRKPGASIANIVVCLLTNPYFVVGFLVQAGALDFG